MFFSKKNYIFAERKTMKVDYKGFTVIDDGTVINKFGKNVGYVGSPKGYRYICFYGRKILKHRFIWSAFYGEIPEGMEIDHIIPISNGGGDNLQNLRLVTSSGNKHNPMTSEKYKTSNKGKSEHFKKSVNKIDSSTGEILKTYQSVGDAAKDVGVKSNVISACLHGRQKTSRGYIWKFS